MRYWDFQPTCNLSSFGYQRNEALALSSLPRLAYNIPHRDMECDACRIIDVLWEYNWTMAFLGDSLTVQSFLAFECELRRRDMYDVYVQEIPLAVIDNGDAPDVTGKYMMRQIHELRVSKKSPEQSTSSPTATIRMFFTYRPKLTEVQYYISGRHDIVIFDHGLHYHDPTVDFPVDMMNLATLLRDSSGSSQASSRDHVNDNVDLKMLAWRETTAQHFNTPTGQYDPAIGSTPCVPHQYQDGVGNERRKAIEQVMQTLNWTERDLVILPFREYTTQFHEMHDSNDCTHFCTTPSFWLYEWQQIRIAMENVLL
jgi:hypothetical protein